MGFLSERISPLIELASCLTGWGVVRFPPYLPLTEVDSYVDRLGVFIARGVLTSIERGMEDGRHQ